MRGLAQVIDLSHNHLRHADNLKALAALDMLQAHARARTHTRSNTRTLAHAL